MLHIQWRSQEFQLVGAHHFFRPTLSVGRAVYFYRKSKLFQDEFEILKTVPIISIIFIGVHKGIPDNNE